MCIATHKRFQGSNFKSDLAMTMKGSSRPSKIVHIRDFKSIDVSDFKEDIAKSPIHTPSSTDPDTLTSPYHKVLSDLLEKHVPLKSKSLMIRPVAPWYNDNVKDLKRQERKAEGRWRKSGLVVHREAYKECRNKLTNAIKALQKKSHTREDKWCKTISNHPFQMC